MIAHEAAKFYLDQLNTYSVVDVREKFGGNLLIVEGKAHIAFRDGSTLSIEKLVRAKFSPDADLRKDT